LSATQSHARNYAAGDEIPQAAAGIIPLSSLPQTSNNLIEKGLAFVRE
jgi:hypothetical protein